MPDGLDIKFLSLYRIERKTIQFIDLIPPDMLPNLNDDDEDKE